MKKYLQRLYPGAKRSIVDIAVYGGASYAFGYVENRYREKASVMGVPASLAAGVALTAGSLLSTFVGGGRIGGLVHKIVPYAQDIGLAGLGAYFHTLGAGKGAQHSGVARIMVDQKDVAKVKAVVPKSTLLGEIPAAPHGDFLSSRDLANLARS
jgi:hypothetical protein